MSSGSYIWTISGKVLKIDAETPFASSDGLSIKIFNTGNPNPLGVYGIDDSGNFSITISKPQFGSANPSLFIMVCDDQQRILYQSSEFTLYQSVNSHPMGNIAVTIMPVPHTWNIRGFAFNGNAATPFTQGTICVYDGETEREEYARAGFASDGSFHLTFDRTRFQNEDFSKTAPYITIRIFDYTPQRIWKRGPFFVYQCDSYINPLVINPPGTGDEVVPNIPPVDDKWRVRGTLRHEDGSPMTKIFTVEAYDVLGENKIKLGQAQTLQNGTYAVEYYKNDFQKNDAFRTAPDLVVEVHSEEGFVIASGIYEKASNDQEIDIKFIYVPENWEVTGTVRDSQGNLVTNGIVSVYDVYPDDIENEIGNVELGNTGRYCFKFKKTAFQYGNALRTAPNLKARLYSPENVPLTRSEVVKNASQNQTIDLTVNIEEGAAEPKYCVYGTVTNRSGLPVAGHLVNAYALCISDNNGKFGEELLRDAVTDVGVETDDYGNYEINYSPEQLEFPIVSDPKSHGADTVSIFIKLLRGTDPVTGYSIYDISPVVCHAAKRQRIDIQVDRHSASDISEYDTVKSALTAYLTALGDDSLDAYESCFSNRIRYLSCKTGVEENKAACFYYSMHIAERIEKEVAEVVFVPPVDFEKFMYATFRAGYPSDVFALCSAEPGKHYQALVEAIRNKIISESTTENLEKFWSEWLKIVRILISYAETKNAETASIGLFARTILDIETSYTSEQKQKYVQDVIEIYQNVQGDMPSFWSKMQAEVDEGKFTELFLAQLIFINDLYSISNGFVSFAQGAYRFFALSKSDSYGSKIDAYNIRNLASLYDGEWFGMASVSLNYTQGKYPTHLAGETEGEQQHILVMMAKKLYEEKFPFENAAAYYANIEENEALREELGDDLSEALQSVGAFLASPAAEEFDLDSTNIDSYDIPETVDIDALKAVQRVNRLTEDPEAQIYLIGEGYDSAYKIALEEEEKFVADNAAKLGGIEEARQVHRLATVYATEALTILGKYHDSLNFSEGNSLVSVSRGVSQIQPPGSDPVPTYKTLFGTLSEARFANSQSVFGASAYFTDLLEFIDSPSRISIFSRRPELKEIELTSGNAETILPYIDIVNEILENAISPRVFFFGTADKFFSEEKTEIPAGLVEALAKRSIGISAASRVKHIKNDDYYLSTGSWRVHFSYKTYGAAKGYLVTVYPQTSKESSELSIMPEHRNPLAYEALSKLYFPLQLPLNPAADEVQETLRLLGTSKCDSIIAFRRNPNGRYEDSDKSLVCANLGISQEVRKLLELQSPSNYKTWELWGLQEQNNGHSWVEVMSYVPDFMQRTGLDVEGMLDVFALKTLNEDNRKEPISPIGDYKGQQTGDPEHFEIQNLNENDLTNIHRLLRLRGILKCSWKELDCFLHSAHGGALPNNLHKISVSRIFMARHSAISFADIGCFWGPLNMRVDKRFGKSPFEERFLSKKVTDETAAVFKELMEKKFIKISERSKKALQQVLQLSVEDLDCIISKEFAPSKEMFDIDSISKILRVVLLANALKISISDFYALKDLTGIDIFNAERPENILYFDDESSRLSARSIKASAVKKFLEEQPDGSEDAKWVQGMVQSIREIVKAAEDFLASSAVPDFGEEETNWDSFKENYRNEQTHLRVEDLLTEKFSEFTGGDSKLADSLLEPKRNFWKGLADVGWSRSINGGTCTVEDFSLPANCSAATWSAVFIAPKESKELAFKPYFNEEACEVVLRINNENEFSAGEMVEIEVVASNIDMSKGYYLDLNWNAETEIELSGNPNELSFAKIPLSALIPANSWEGFEKLKSTLPVFRKTAEYFELTKMDSAFFKAVTEKMKEGEGESKWSILLPEEIILKSDNFADVAWEKFKRLLDIQTLYSKFPAGKSSFWEMVEAVEKANGNALECLAGIQNAWDKSNLISVVNSSGGASDIASPAMLAYILENMPVIEKIGVPVDKLLAVLKDDTNEEKVTIFRGALQQHLGMSSWNKMVEDMMNALRIRQRDAMTAFLTHVGPSIAIASANDDSSYATYLRNVLANAGVLEENGNVQDALNLYSKLITTLAPLSNGKIGPAQWGVLDGRKGYRDSNEMYANFLIDTEMNTEMITSRIVQASAAIQLFVQRVLLGLEPASCLDEREITQWIWVKNYRVWEANRKVFLYPENWIEPELRDDKTPFFKELEEEFENGEITSEIAKKALGNFLGKIREVSGLDIIGVCGGESNNPRGKDSLHIIGKTKSMPHKYYYRCCHRKNNLANVWDPWETIDADMQGSSVLPVMFNGHLYVFWAQFKPVDNPAGNDDGDKNEQSIMYKDDSDKKDPIELPVPKNTAVVELSLCWTAFADGKWTEKKQTPSFIDIDNDFYTNQDPGVNVADRYHFSISGNSDEYVQIKVHKTRMEEEGEGEDEVLKISLAGIYTIWHDGNAGFAKEAEKLEKDFLCDPKDTLFIENHAVSFESKPLTRLNETLLLGRTDGGFKYLSANSGQLAGSSGEPGFLMENSRTYLIDPSDNNNKAATCKMEIVSHPIVKEFQRRFENGNLVGLMRRETQALAMATGRYYGYSYYSYNYYFSILLGYYIAGDWQAWDSGQNAFELRYLPNRNAVSGPFPMEVVDFNYGTPYGIYNWELFFHAPFLVARQLAANQRYDEALDWYHLIFDPRSNKLSGYERTKRWALNLPAGARFWNFLPFFANADANKTIMELMGLPDSRGEMPDSQALKTLIDDWKNDPFNPHLIARSRIVSYQKAVVMHYLDALLAWADQKFRIDTLESINEAIQLYILAAEVLGVRPQSVPSNHEAEPLSYTQMHSMSMDSFSNVVVQLENTLVKPIAEAKSTGQGPIADSAKQVLGLGPKMYYFVVPRNDKLMGYWDLLDDRLFKIRNGMNIEGVKRQLSLFAPPIDPGMLVKAAAAGIDIGAALSDMFTPVPKYRFTFMVQKAIELCNFVQSMGGAVLSALEKKDAEEIARLRAEHEGELLKLSKEVRKMQIDEAGIAIDGLEKTKATMEFRREHYEKLLSGGVSSLEQSQLDSMDYAMILSQGANAIRIAASPAAAIPDITVGASGFGGSPHVTTTVSVAKTGVSIASIIAGGIDFLAALAQNSAAKSGIRAGYRRREQEWEFQRATAEKEIEGIDRQILGAQIRKQVAEKELGNLEKQIEQSGEIHAFLKNKYTNKELYQWMIKELSLLYNKIYQLAYDTAKRAEKSYGFELGISDSSFIQFGHWDSLRKGLLAGERLMLDLRRMEMAYIEKNGRELEITKPISIAQLNPKAILDLQKEGSCKFSLPEALFDLDFPGHYFRRIRSVRLTIPCVAGPYTSVSATLRLLTNTMRKNPTGSSYPRNEDGDDPRFVDQRVGIQGIATSQPNDATGMFDFNFRDERYLPFEGAGAESLWELELPKGIRQFDYRTISDIVLHVSYTAREDGRLKEIAGNWIKDSIDVLMAELSKHNETLNHVFSIKRDFPDAWKSLLKNGEATIEITPEHYPYFLKDQELSFVELPSFFALDDNGKRKDFDGSELIITKSKPLEYYIQIDKETLAAYNDIILSMDYSINA